MPKIEVGEKRLLKIIKDNIPKCQVTGSRYNYVHCRFEIKEHDKTVSLDVYVTQNNGNFHLQYVKIDILVPGKSDDTKVSIFRMSHKSKDQKHSYTLKKEDFKSKTVFNYIEKLAINKHEQWIENKESVAKNANDERLKKCYGWINDIS